MADRFWVGGTGTWDSSDTTHWSATSGGAAGASVPGAADTAKFDANSGGGTVTASGPGTIAALDMSAAAAMTLAGSTGSFTINGNVTLGANVTYTITIALQLFSGICSFTSNGRAIANSIQIGDSTGGTSCAVTLADALSTSGSITIQGGTLDANGFSLSCLNLTISNTTLNKTLTFGTATHTIGGNFTINEAPGGDFTLTASTGKLVFTDTNGFSAANDNTYEVNDIDVTSLASGNADIGLTCRNLNFTGSTGGAWTNSTIVKGNLTLAVGMSAATSTKQFTGSSGTQVITSNGVTIDGNVTVNASGAVVQLADALLLGSTRTLTLTSGVLNANNQSFTCGAFSSSNSNVRTLTLGSATHILSGIGTGVWDITTSTNMTLNANTSTIKMTATGVSERHFHGGDLIYNNFWHSPSTGAGTLRIFGNNTFNDFKDDGTVAHIIIFNATDTQTVSSFTVSGASAAARISLRSSLNGTQAFLSKSSGIVSCDYLDIRDSNASGGAIWNPGVNSINSGNNIGWLFSSVADVPEVGFVTTIIQSKHVMVGY